MGVTELDEQKMSCRAAIRVLYDLAGPHKTWPELARDLRIKESDAKRIWARNDNWPKSFGKVEYRQCFDAYVEDEHGSKRAALISIRKTLKSCDAMTPEVNSIFDDIEASEGDDAVSEGIDRLRDVIIETAEPGRWRRAGQADHGTPAGCSASLPAVGTSRDATDEGVPFGGPSACGRLLTLRDLWELLASEGVSSGWEGRRVILREFAADEEFVRALLPAEVVGELLDADALARSMEGACPPAVRDRVIEALCLDSGLGCRKALERCRALMAAADVPSFLARAGRVVDASLAARGPGVRAGGSPCPCLPPEMGRGFWQFADDDAPRALLALALAALLGEGAARVLACEANGYLFAR